jgi:hypothetical protein
VVTIGAANAGGAAEFIDTIRSMIGVSAKDPAVTFAPKQGLLVVRSNSAGLRRVKTSWTYSRKMPAPK